MTSKILLFGENVRKEPALQYYDTNLDEWSNTIDKEHARFVALMMASGAEEVVYFTEGFQRGPEFYAYDTKTDTISQLMDMPYERDHGAASLLDGHFYVLGGVDVAFELIQDVERYDPQDDVWTSVAPLKECRYDPGVANLNGKLYAIGSFTCNDYWSNTCECYDPERNEWSIIPVFPDKLQYGISVHGGTNKLWAIQKNSLKKMYCYYPHEEEWETIEPTGVIPPVHKAHLLVAENRMFVVDERSALYEYIPTINEWERWTDNPGDMAYVWNAVVI